MLLSKSVINRHVTLDQLNLIVNIFQGKHTPDPQFHLDRRSTFRKSTLPISDQPTPLTCKCCVCISCLLGPQTGPWLHCCLLLLVTPLAYSCKLSHCGVPGCSDSTVLEVHVLVETSKNIIGWGEPERAPH